MILSTYIMTLWYEYFMYLRQNVQYLDFGPCLPKRCALQAPDNLTEGLAMLLVQNIARSV